MAVARTSLKVGPTATAASPHRERANIEPRVARRQKPGFIGSLGTLLGEQVNIATFHLGRDAPGGSAIALVQVDQPISPELLKKIAALEGVVQAKLLSF